MTVDRPRIDVLLERIADPALRDQLTAEVESLGNQRKFGLVYEGHAPEAIRIPGARIRRDATVQLREGKDQRVWKVIRAARTGLANLVDQAGERLNDVPVADLIVARELGDPVYPGFTPLGSIERGGDKPHHLVIQGENYHALQTLLYTHKESVDLIYIDPPYNTGAGDWIYNDRYVGDADAYRHSKWLSFIEKRLELARKLLKTTGVIIVAIDDNEHHRLRMLLDQEFGEKNFLANVVWQGGASSLAKHTGGGVDYMVIYAADRDAHIGAVGQWRVAKSGANEVLSVAKRIWADSNGDSDVASQKIKAWWKLNKANFDSSISVYNQIDGTGKLFFANNLANGMFRPNLQYDIPHPVTGKPVKMPGNGWRHEKKRMTANIEAGLIVFGKDESTIPTMKLYLEDYLSQVPPQSFVQDRRSSTLALASILESKDFPFPKHVETISQWLGTVTGNNPESVILDFFAGTGTTAEAVMQLNAQDGGRRQAIVVTNNELAKKDSTRLTKAGYQPGDPEWEAEGVFEKVTRPRLETVVSGVRRDGTALTEPSANGVGKAIKGATGYNENVSFVKLDYLERDDIELGEAFRKVAELLWVKAGSVGPVITERSDSYSFTDRYGVLFNTDLGAGFEAEAERRGVSMVFIITDSTEVFGAVKRLLPETMSAVHLYRNYLSNFEINTRKVN